MRCEWEDGCERDASHTDPMPRLCHLHGMAELHVVEETEARHALTMVQEWIDETV